MKEKMNVVVIGHIDHGKSTLLGRLLYDSGTIKKRVLEEIRKTVEESFGKFEYAHILDTLQEEREGHMTIDIMHTWFSTDKREYTFIDCPGHHEFVRNMLTGASKAEGAILVVSVVEGVEDQTREHALLAKFVGIGQFLIAVNKMDAVKWKREEYERIKKEVTEMLEEIGVKKFVFVPISAIQGDNIFKKSRHMDWQGKTLVEVMDELFEVPKKKGNEPNLGVVQYSFDDKIVGRVESGSFKRGDELLFEPSGLRGVVEEMSVCGEPCEEASSGDVVELRVSGMKGKVSRGEVFAHAYLPKKKEEIIGEIFTFTELFPGKGYVLHRGTAQVKCRISEILEKMDPRKLSKTKGGVVEKSMLARVRISMEEPIVIEDFTKVPSLGRFVITGPEGIVCAGKYVG